MDLGESVKNIETINTESKDSLFKMLTKEGRLIYSHLSKNKH